MSHMATCKRSVTGIDVPNFHGDTYEPIALDVLKLAIIDTITLSKLIEVQNVMPRDLASVVPHAIVVGLGFTEVQTVFFSQISK